MIPVLVDGVKKYLLTEDEIDAKISASGGGSSSEIPGQITVIYGDVDSLPTGNEWVGKFILHIDADGCDMLLKSYMDTDGTGIYRWAVFAQYRNDF